MSTALSMLFSVVLSLVQEAPAGETPLKECRVGDRIEVTLKNESVFRGTIDFVTPERLGLDISLEAVDLNGILTLSVAEIAEAKKLQLISAADAEKILAKKKAEAERLAAESRKMAEALKKQEEEAAKREEEELLKGLKVEEKSKADEVLEKMKRLGEGMALLKKFPPEAGWGEEKLALLKAQFLKTKVPLSEDERTFINNFALWKEAKEYVESETKKANAETAPKDKKAEEPPKPAETKQP